MDTDAMEQMRQQLLAETDDDDKTTKRDQVSNPAQFGALDAPPPPPGMSPVDPAPGGDPNEAFASTTMLDPDQVAAMQADLNALDAEDGSATAMLDPEAMAAMREQAHQSLGVGPDAGASASPSPATNEAPKPDAPVSPFLSQGIPDAAPAQPDKGSSTLTWALAGGVFLIAIAIAVFTFVL